jgi:hypothetical protein
MVIDLCSCPNKARKTPNSASQVSNISFANWAILSSVSALWVHTSSVSYKKICVAPLLVVRRKKEKKREVFHRKMKKKDKYFDLPIRGYTICADHSYLLFLVLDHPGLHLEHMLDQQQFAHLNPYSALLLCFRIVFLDTIYFHPSSDPLSSQLCRFSLRNHPHTLSWYTLPCI